MLHAKAKLKFPFNTPHCNATIYAYRQAGIAGSILYIYGFEVLLEEKCRNPYCKFAFRLSILNTPEEKDFFFT